MEGGEKFTKQGFRLSAHDGRVYTNVRTQWILELISISKKDFSKLSIIIPVVPCLWSRCVLFLSDEVHCLTILRFLHRHHGVLGDYFSHGRCSWSSQVFVTYGNFLLSFFFFFCFWKFVYFLFFNSFRWAPLESLWPLSTIARVYSLFLFQPLSAFLYYSPRG